jgi:hypothetical protein
MLLPVVIILVGLLPSGPLPPRLLRPHRASLPLSLAESRSGLLYSERIRECAPSLLPKLEGLQDQDLDTIDQCACPPGRHTLVTPHPCSTPPQNPDTPAQPHASRSHLADHPPRATVSCAQAAERARAERLVPPAVDGGTEGGERAAARARGRDSRLAPGPQP